MEEAVNGGEEKRGDKGLILRPGAVWKGWEDSAASWLPLPPRSSRTLTGLLPPLVVVVVVSTRRRRWQDVTLQDPKRPDGAHQMFWKGFQLTRMHISVLGRVRKCLFKYKTIWIVQQKTAPRPLPVLMSTTRSSTENNRRSSLLLDGRHKPRRRWKYWHSLALKECRCRPLVPRLIIAAKDLFSFLKRSSWK